MSHPGDQIQASIYAALKAHAPLAAIMGGECRVYDRVPRSPVFPYITIGEEQLNDESNSCDADVYECFFDIHTWADAVGLPQGKNIAAQVRAAILAGLPGMTGWHAGFIQYRNERHFRDNDGMRGHTVQTFRALIETT